MNHKKDSLPQRKPTRLNGYDYNTAGAYFITVCVENRKNLLSRIVGGDALDAPQNHLTKTGEIVQKNILWGNGFGGVTVDKFVIMPNHIHMILFVEDGPSRASAPTHAAIPQFISSWKRLCSKELGNNIFQRSYHDHVIRGDADYVKIWQYIDTNPVKWQEDCFYNDGICSEDVQ